MTKQELRQVRYLPKEMKLLQRERDSLSAQLNDYLVTDSVMSSSHQVPYTPRSITIQGILDTDGYLQTKAKLMLTESQLSHCRQLDEQMERFIADIPDSLLRQIFRLYYKQGKTWQQVAFEIGECDESYPRRKARDYLNAAGKPPACSSGHTS